MRRGEAGAAIAEILAKQDEAGGHTGMDKLLLYDAAAVFSRSLAQSGITTARGNRKELLESGVESICQKCACEAERLGRRTYGCQGLAANE